MKVECCWWSLYTGKPQDKVCFDSSTRSSRINQNGGLEKNDLGTQTASVDQAFQGEGCNSLRSIPGTAFWHWLLEPCLPLSLLPVYYEMNSFIAGVFHSISLSPQGFNLRRILSQHRLSSCKFPFLRCFGHRYAKVRNSRTCLYTMCCLIFDTILAWQVS